VCAKICTELYDPAAEDDTFEQQQRAANESDRGNEALLRLRETFQSKSIPRLERQQFTFLCRKHASVCRATLRKMLQRVDIVMERNELELIYKAVGMDALGKIKLELILPMNMHGPAMCGSGYNKDDVAQPHNHDKTGPERKQVRFTAKHFVPLQHKVKQKHKHKHKHQTKPNQTKPPIYHAQ
jgi:hypothetical protein